MTDQVKEGATAESTFAFVGFLAWVPGPVAVTWLIGIVYPPAPLYSLYWLLIVYPHQWLVRARPAGFDPILSGSAALSFAIVQWVAVAALFTWSTQRLNLRSRVLLAPLVIFLAGILTNFAVSQMGWTVQADWV